MDTIASPSPTDRVMNHLAAQGPSPAEKEFILKFVEPRNYLYTPHLEVLSQPKAPYHSKDFFLNKDFRGLFLADHQEAIGDKAFECVDELNKNVLN